MPPLAHRAGLLLVLLMCAAFAGGPSQIRAQEVAEITILHDTHFHGQVIGPNGVTLAHYVGEVRRLRAASRGALWLGAGDDLGASQWSSVFKGMHMVEALNAGGLDANTYGNHDFDYGPDNLVAMVRASRFAWVSANVIDTRTGDVFAAEAGARKYIIKDVNGVRVGITGLSWKFLAATKAGPHVEVLDPIEAMAALVPQMRAAGAQVVVAMAHLCAAEQEAVAQAVPGIDAIVGDHCAQRLAFPGFIGPYGTILSRRGDEYRPIGRLVLRYERGRIATFAYQEHAVTRGSPEDPAVKAVLDRYREQLDIALSEPLGITTVPLDARAAIVQAAESNLGNYIADVLRAWGQADVAVLNGGGIRGDRVFGPGTLTRGDIFTILPFNHTGVLLRISGEGLWMALENGVSRMPPDGRFPQVSGLVLRFDPHAPVGTRLIAVTLGGEPLDRNRLYVIATNDFLAGGGDGYEAFKSAEILVPTQNGPLLADLLIEALQRDGTIAPRVEGRILVGPP